MINVWITDDHPLAIKGLENMLSQFSHISITAGYTSAAALLAALEQSHPQVVLLDVLLPDKTGDEVAGLITKHYPDVKILAISSLDAPTHVKKMLKNGCKGYVLKNIEQATLVEAIEKVDAGEEYLDAAIKEKWTRHLQNYKQTVREKTAPITRRELDVLRLIAREYSNQEIADELFLSLRTVENHRFNLQQKLEVKNTAGLINTAIQMGFLEQD